MLRQAIRRTNFHFNFISVKNTRFYSSQPPSVRYEQLVKAGKVARDSKQMAALTKLDELYHRCMNYSPSDRVPPPKSIYMYGGVGSGKTLLMQLFYESVKTTKKKQIHFNQFMLNFHQRVHKKRKEEPKKDHVPDIIDELVNESWLLCFDEFQVTDIADAMIIKRVFEGLFSKGAVVVSTSNRPPEDLYLNGINRESFLPFIDFLKSSAIVHNMDAEHDYRLRGMKQKDIYMAPVNEENSKKLDELFKKLTNNEPAGPMVLQVMGRDLYVPLARRNIARFTFDELCVEELGAADYMTLAQNFHTIIISNIPKMNIQHRNIVRRFILLIDELYQHRVKLLCTAQAPPEELFVTETGEPVVSQDGEKYEIDEAFALHRTISRLHEMTTQMYLESSHLKIK